MSEHQNSTESLDKQKLLDWISNRKLAIEQVIDNHTGYHKRHLTGQHSSLVDVEWEITNGRFDIAKQGQQDSPK